MAKTKAANGDTPETEENGGPDKGLILLNSLGTYAMKMTRERKQFELRERTLYEERTEIPNPFAKPGEPNVKVYEAGEYGPWRMAPLPFPAGKDAPILALTYVRNWVAMDEIQKADVMNLDAAIEYFEMAKQDILDTLKRGGLI